MITANPTDDDGVADGVLAVVVVIVAAVAVAVIVVVAVVVAAATGIVVVHCVTALFGTLQAIVVLLSDATASRETVAQIGVTSALVAPRPRVALRGCDLTIRLLSHFLQVLERAEDLLVEHVALLAGVIGRSHVGRASHHRHAVHLLADLDHDLRTACG